MFQKIKVWWALRKAKKIENQNMPNEKDLKKEEIQFLYEAEELKKLINKPIKAKPTQKKATPVKNKAKTKKKAKVKKITGKIKKRKLVKKGKSGKPTKRAKKKRK